MVWSCELHVTQKHRSHVWIDIFPILKPCAGGNRCCGIISLHLDIWISKERQGLHSNCRWGALSPEILILVGWVERVYEIKRQILLKLYRMSNIYCKKGDGCHCQNYISVSSALICVVDLPMSAAYCWMLMNTSNQLLCRGFLLIFSCPICTAK